MTPLHTWARQRGFGRLAYQLFHAPAARIHLARSYGWQLSWRAWREEKRMRQTAATLPPLPPSPAPLPAPICFLTGRDFLHQTLFCAHSFTRRASVQPDFVFLSDGSLTPEIARTLRQKFPSATVLDDRTQEQAVTAALPPGKFPVLHALRRKFVLLRKLTDAMAGQRGYRLFFDSDMLFWREPRELISRVGDMDALYMADIGENGYTASRDLIMTRFAVPVAVGVNSGLVGLVAERIDWELLERICAFLLQSPGDQRLLEQTLCAVALGAQGARPLDPQAYQVVIDPIQWSVACGKSSPPLLLHYAWHARLPYVAGEWRRYLKESAACPRTSSPS